MENSLDDIVITTVSALVMDEALRDLEDIESINTDTFSEFTQSDFTKSDTTFSDTFHSIEFDFNSTALKTYIEDNFLCSICNDFRVPDTNINLTFNMQQCIRCQKPLCTTCLERITQCPQCKHNHCFISAKMLMNSLQELKMRCPYPTCEWNGEFSNWSHHLHTECKAVKIQCPFAKYGCKNTGLKREDLYTHIQNHETHDDVIESWVETQNYQTEYKVHLAEKELEQVHLRMNAMSRQHTLEMQRVMHLNCSSATRRSLHSHS